MALPTARRSFLTLSAKTAAVAGVSACCPTVGAGDPASSNTTPITSPLELGLRPKIGCFGPVVFADSAPLRIAFSAESASGEGTALLEFSNCRRWWLSGGFEGAEQVDGFDSDSLPPCDIFERIAAQSVEPTRRRKRRSRSASTRPARERSSERHFIVTFLGVHERIEHTGRNFECLAESIHAEWLPGGSFDDVAGYVRMLGS